MEVSDLLAILDGCDSSFPVFVTSNGKYQEITSVSPLVLKLPDGSTEIGYLLSTDGKSVDQDTTEEQNVLDRLSALGYDR